ncbi:MAG: penicillin-insensitive murein endopeptidase, partial [Myxococcales bacterium]|nr:penicillin-insensitive murein endopeptidase [Myxococcales bacterium]
QLGWRMPAHSPGELPQWIRHQTLPRETIDQLAIRYGVRADSLRAWNDMAADGEPAQRKPEPLRIYAQRFPPPRQQLNHAVREGESWGSIARIYGVDSSRLRVWNVSDTGRSLEVGETLAVWIDPVVYDSIVHDQPGSDRAALVRPGAHGVGTPQAGILVAGVQIPEGEGYELRYPNSAWGTTWAVRHTVAALDDFHERSGYGGIIEVGTMSRIRGGRIGGHVSHQSGRDLDIRLPSKGVGKFERVDWMATWELVLAFLRTGAVERIFLDTGGQRRLWRSARKAGLGKDEVAELLQYPRGSRSNFGVLRHSPGHQGHIHVRFTCGPAEPECGIDFSPMSASAETDPKWRLPHTLALVFAVLCVVAVLGSLAPGGSYLRDEAGRVIPGSFSFDQGGDVGLRGWRLIPAMFLAPVRGMVAAADIVAFVLLVGGTFGVLERSGALEAGISALVGRLQRRAGVLIPVSMLAFAVGGAVFGMSEEVIPFVLLFVPLMRGLGYPRIIAAAVPL